MLTMLIDDGRPQAPGLKVEVCPWSIERRLNHDQLGDWIDTNVLSLIAHHCKLTAVPAKKPKQVAIAKQLRSSSG